MKGTTNMKVTTQKIANTPDPVRAHSTDAGLDLHVPEGQGCLVRPGAVYTIDLGVRIGIPDGYYGQLTLRSSAGKKGLTIPNGVGVIDSGYRGNVKLLVAALAEPVLITAGERICQLIILPLPAVTWEPGIVDDVTDRGASGFGSTGAGCEHVIKQPLPRDRIDLTVGGLMRELQEIAFRYGTDTPIVVHTRADADYEQAAAPIVMHVRRETVPDDWDLFHIDPTGDAAAVIS